MRAFRTLMFAAMVLATTACASNAIKDQAASPAVDAAGVGNSGCLPAQRPASICDATLPGCGEHYRDCCRGR